MILRIDPTRSLVWRTPTTLQIGLGASAVVLENVAALDERLVSALLVGTTREALAVVATQVGGTPTDAASLIRRLEPAFVPPHVVPRSRALRLAIDGRGATAEKIAELAALDGISVVAHPDDADVAVIVGQYTIAPSRYAVWLGRDIDHLAVVHGDDSTVVGPFVQPGRGPCLYCRDRARVDDDGAWPVIASQLDGRPSPRETGATVSEIAALAVRLVVAHDTRSVDPLVDRAMEISAAPFPVVRRYRVHPECGCRSPQGNATVHAASSIVRRTRPTRPAVDDVPA
ncbi:hypothetical protein CLV49_3547 [Labedella gwakjiensis]|uniref:Bacteriocin biosynthesis cyclodehydratase domain-containing protein n=1 Tax=Labedella gwakjiensis TaxID=390269 RepID=A0A2P8H101_9MICO|nr:hypothetical protein CLV49_3547 [Labedella gwakjiensis]